MSATDPNLHNTATDVVGAVTIRDVGPRDGLQSLPSSFPVGHRVDLIEGLRRAGVQRVEVGSFVSERAVPQMAGSAEVLEAIRGRSIVAEVLVVTAAKVQPAIEAGADRIVFPVAASETFSQANVRMSVSEAIEECRRAHLKSSEVGVELVADVATAFGCAYEGVVPHRAVVDVAAAVSGFGVTEITLADTTGMAAPGEIGPLIDAVAATVGSDVVLGLHLHDTRGLGLANAWAGLEAGVRLFDSSIGGLGGCPFSPGASGNIATEDLVHMLEASGFSTGIDLDALIEVGRRLEQDLDLTLPARLLRTGPRWALRARTR